METGKCVQILLSTYNGEKYLKDQLNSFFELEEFEKCKILIRDDGSIDGTRVILQQYEKYDQFDIVYGENMGITASYLWLMEHSDKSCRYFALSDQDDIWLPNKISLAMSVLNGKDNTEPVLYGTLSHIVDEDLKPICDMPIPRRPVTYYNAMIQNVLPGHTQMLNRAMLELIIRHEAREVHVIDWWFYLAGSAVGEIVFLPEYTVLHRLHTTNAVGGNSGFFKSILRRIGYIRAGKGNALSKQLNAFYQIYRAEMPEEYCKETEKFLTQQQNMMTRLRYIMSCKAYRQSINDNFAFRCLYLIGKYKI